MKSRGTAMRFARGLESVLSGPDELARAADEMAAVASLVTADRRLAGTLSSPAVATAAKKDLLARLSSEARLSPKTGAFLATLADLDALGLLGDVAAAVASLRDRRLGIVEAEVTTASPLSADEAERVRQVLEKRTGKKVRISLRTDPSVIGGLRAQVGSTVYDATVSGRLVAMRAALVRG